MMFLRCIILLCVFAASTPAQQNTGTLRGTVTDQRDSLVVGASVTVRDANGLTTSATTNTAPRCLREE